MPYIVKASRSSYLPAGMHVVAVKNIEEVENMADPAKTQLKIGLESTEEESTDMQAVFWTSPLLHPKGKLLPFAEAALGRQLTTEEKRDGFDVETLIGRKLCIIVKDAVSKAGKPFAKVSDFMPVKQS